MTPNSYPAVMLAVNDINGHGGVGGVRIELAGLDWTGAQSSFNAVAVQQVATRFADNRDLLVVIGHSDSASTLSAAPTYNKRGLPQLVTIATNPAITNIGAWTYRTCLSDAAQGPALAEYAVREWKKRRIAMIFVNDDYGRGLAQLFERRVHELGGELVGSVMHRNALDAEDKEAIGSALAEMKQGAPPDLIVLFQRVEAAKWTIRAIRAAGLSVDLLASDNLAQNTVAEMDPALTATMKVSQFFYMDPARPRTEAFAKGFRAFAKREPDYSDAFAFDAVCLAKDAIAGGGFTRAGVRAYLDRLIRDRVSIEGAGGPFVIGADHDARRPLYIAEIRDRRFHVIKALPVR